MTWLKELESDIALLWKKILTTSHLSKIVSSEKFDQRLYALYLLETYQYTLHNSRNQALVAACLPTSADIKYLKFCLKHAYEEAGHELMALHDLKNLGKVSLPSDLPAPMRSTEVLIAYLYQISETGNLVGRLGYSLWAEDAYSHISSLLLAVQKKLSLRPSQMTFLGAHAEIDAGHIEVVREMITYMVHNEDDRLAVRNVAMTSLELTGRMLDDIAYEYENLVEGKSLKYKFLNSLV
jgi:hypothetical protein